MAYSINDFINSLSSGLQRANRWQVSFSFPNSIAIANSTAQNATLWARTANTPASNVGIIEVNFQGRVIPVAGDRRYDAFTVQFISTNDKTVRAALESWSESINGGQSNTGLVSPVDYMCDVQLDMLDQNDNITKTYILQDAWPTQVGQEELDMGAMDTNTVFTCEFRYVAVLTDTSN